MKAPLGAITKIDRALKNSVEKIPPVKALAQILPACSSMKWDKTVYRNTYDTIIELVTVSPYNYILHCLPDREAAIICHKTISRK